MYFSPRSFRQVLAGVACRHLWGALDKEGQRVGAGPGAGVEGGTAEPLPARKAATARWWGREVVDARPSSCASPGSGLRLGREGTMRP